MQELAIPQPPGDTATSAEEAVVIADRIGYPVLVRPSYVLGGRAMEIVENQKGFGRLYATCSQSFSRTSCLG